MFAEESLETCLICAQETGEIPPQESDSAANWLGMLRPVFVTAWCFRCLGKYPPRLAEHLCKCSLRCRCSARMPVSCTSQGLAPTLSPASVSHTQNHHLILLVMLAILFLKVLWVLCRKNKR